MQNNLYDLLSHLTEVRVTFAKQNLRCLEDVLDHYRIPKDQKDEWITMFMAETAQFGSFVFDVEKRTFERDAPVETAAAVTPSSGSGPEAGTVEDPTAPYRKTAQKYLTVFCASDPARASLIFDYIITKIPLHNLNSSDLSLRLRDKRSGRTKTYHILDFLAAICQKEGPRPSNDVLALNAYINRHVSLPACFAANIHMRNER